MMRSATGAWSESNERRKRKGLYMLRKIILSTAAVALVATPLAAQAAPVRTASPVGETEELSQALVAVIGGAVFALLVLLLSDNNSNTAPTSP